MASSNWDVRIFFWLFLITSTVRANYIQQSPNQLEEAVRQYDQLKEIRQGLTAVKRMVLGWENNMYSPNVEGADALKRRRDGLELLKYLLLRMDTELVQQQKRMCRLNLGGHCATESVAAMANQWHFFNSAGSPGRKRRSASSFMGRGN